MSDRMPRAGIGSRIVLAIGLVLTIGMLTPYRPWGVGPSPWNSALLLGPVLLAAGAASAASRPRQGAAAAARPGPKRGGSAAGAVSGVGLAMLLVGGCPWIYTPVFFGGDLGGKVDSASGMIGTIIFLFIGLPGLTITAVGLVNLLKQRWSRGVPGSPPDAPADRDGPSAGA